jgi:D-sedoheptulose 7-phosphate isomerase
MVLKTVEEVLDNVVFRYPVLRQNKKNIELAFKLLSNSYQNSNKLLICGNGGSAADADHIVGELMKSFAIKRKLPQKIKDKFIAVSDVYGKRIAENLEPALPAISLGAHVALNSAFSNDVDPELIYAQQVNGFGQKGDVLLCISTSGNSSNVVYAAVTGKALGLHVIALTGESGGLLQEYCDVHIGVKGGSVAEIQELHLPVYHTLCKMLEIYFFNTN